MSRRLHDLKEIRKGAHQVENYHLFQEPCHRLVEIEEVVCQEKEKDERSHDATGEPEGNPRGAESFRGILFITLSYPKEAVFSSS